MEHYRKDKTIWRAARQMELSLRDIWGMEQHKPQFFFRSDFDVLSNPTNSEDPRCHLYEGIAALEHIQVVIVSKSLQGGRYI